MRRMPGHRAVARSLLLVGALLCAGCAAPAPSGSTSAPVSAAPASAAASPTVTPEPTPDPVALAVEAFASKDLRAHVVLDASLMAQDTTITVAGTMDVIGDAEHETYEVKVGDQVVETRQVISLGVEEWEMLGTGPWHDADGTDDTALVTDLAELTSLTIVSEETLDGKPVIHVRPAPGVTLSPSGWGPSDADVTGWTSDALDLWIEADGTLVKLEQTERWQQPSGTGTVAVTQHTIETFSPLAASATITPPADAWVAFTSATKGYTMSQPDGYIVAMNEGRDTFLYGGAPAITVTSLEADARLQSIDDYVQALAATYKRSMGAKLLRSVPAGQTNARIMVFKVKDEQGHNLRLVDAVMVENGRMWEIFRVGTPETVDDDVAYVGDSLTTFDAAS